MTLTMYHGTSRETLPLHEGLCLVPDDERAWEYARQAHVPYGECRYVHEVELNLEGLTVAVADGYDHEENRTPSDWDDDSGADVLAYDDETACGRAHVTYRLMTQAALAALRPAGTDSEEK